ncbi:MFS family permease [Bacillus sp. SORGH_AS 510]|uniref:MFS transporter n=1 Tax=Bacillus sp. SORGH_AS_0510 TaxID=3041771 RepID=UPI00278922DC|nr:MFS transporter [Bacillus sp. SORGH_AS_0510]MDQ1145833.1 MFS family permease [Bacillus sp. SORGH_AS_0510]
MENHSRKRLWGYAAIGMLTTVVVLAFARLSYGVILPFMRQGLHLTYKEAGYLGTTTSLGYLSTIIFAGILASRWGGKRTILLGISLVTLGLAGLTFTSSYLTTFLFMLLLGIGTSFTYTPFISLLVAWFPQKKGFVIGLTTSGAGIGILFAGIIVPYLSSVHSAVGWRIAWGVFAFIGLVVILLTLLFIKNPPVEFLSEQSNKTESPREIYKNPKVINVGLIYGIVGITYIVQMIFIMSFMIESGINIKFAGQLMAINGILSIFSGPIWGFISDKIGRRTSLILTMALTLFSMVLPIFFPTVLGFTIHIIILSSTSTGLFTLTQASSMDHVRPEAMPLAFSYVTFYFAVGQFIGPTIAGWLIEDLGGFKSAFLFSSLCLVIGLFLTFKVRNSDQHVFRNSNIPGELSERVTQ